MNQKGLALVTVLIFTLVMSILAGAVLSLMTTEARLTEHQVRRIKAYYAAQSGMIYELENLRKNPLPPDSTTTFTYSAADLYPVTISVAKVNQVDPLKDTRSVSATVDYKP